MSARRYPPTMPTPRNLVKRWRERAAFFEYSADDTPSDILDGCADSLEESLNTYHGDGDQITSVGVAAAKVVEGFDKGIFVRNTLTDTDPNWVMRVIPYLQALALLSGGRIDSCGTDAPGDVEDVS